MNFAPTQKTVSTEPPTLVGSVDTVPTTFLAPEMAVTGAAGGVTTRCSVGTSPAKPPNQGVTSYGSNDVSPLFEDSDGADVVPGPAEPQNGGATPKRLAVKYAKPMASCEASCLIMRGDLELAIRDLQKCRSFSWISQELRIQLGRCLYELTATRRMCP
jgi:hypothetical protein